MVLIRESDILMYPNIKHNNIIILGRNKLKKQKQINQEKRFSEAKKWYTALYLQTS